MRQEFHAALPSRPRQRGFWAGAAVQKGIDELHGVLEEGERVEMASVGTIDSRGVLIVGSDRRLIVFDRGYGRRAFYDYAYVDVDRVEWRKGLHTGEIAVVPRSGIGVRIKNVPGGHVKPLGQWLTRRSADAHAADPR